MSDIKGNSPLTETSINDNSKTILQPAKIKPTIEDVYPEAIQAEMNYYNQFLDDIIASNSELPVANADENHGALLMTKLFEQTKQKFAMVVGSFSGDISNKANYLAALTDCLEQKNVDARVLILNKPNEESSAFVTLKAHQSKGTKVKIKYATFKTLEYLKQKFVDNKILHFAVFDDNKYRLEISPEKFKAIAGFHNENSSKELMSIFNEAFDTGSLEPQFG